MTVGRFVRLASATLGMLRHVEGEDSGASLLCKTLVYLGYYKSTYSILVGPAPRFGYTALEECTGKAALLPKTVDQRGWVPLWVPPVWPWSPRKAAQVDVMESEKQRGRQVYRGSTT